MRPTPATFCRLPADTNERLYVLLKPGETLYYGVRRYDRGNDRDNLRLQLYENDSTLVRSDTLLREAGSDVLFDLDQPGVIDSYAQSAIGPIVPGVPATSGGYEPISYTNTTGVTQRLFLSLRNWTLTITAL